MAIELCNLRYKKPSKPWDVKVDRSSVLGNPFKGGTRESQCQRFEESFESRRAGNSAIRTELDRLLQLYRQHGKLRLFCWCVPLQ